jgi:lysozyme
MARREITLGIIGAGLLAALLISRRAFAAEPWDEYGNFSLDYIAEENAPSLIEGVTTLMQPDIMEAANNPNVQAFLSMIGTLEGGPQGYNALFGGGRFESFADHPRVVIRAGGYSSSAAGRYQILQGTWDDIRDTIGAPDFSPPWQDLAAIYLIRRRGALADVIAGDFDSAVTKAAKEWASLPGAGYGQPERALEETRALYASAGGGFA